MAVLGVFLPIWGVVPILIETGYRATIGQALSCNLDKLF